MTAKEIATKYHMRILSWLSTLRRKLLAAGFVCDTPEAMHADTFKWGLSVDLEAELGPDKNVYIEWYVCESQFYGEKPGGVSFLISVYESGGLVLGGVEIQNRTKDAFVPIDDPMAVAQRFVSFEEADPESLVKLVKYHLDLEQKLKKGKEESGGQKQ